MNIAHRLRGMLRCFLFVISALFHLCIIGLIVLCLCFVFFIGCNKIDIVILYRRIFLYLCLLWLCIYPRSRLFFFNLFFLLNRLCKWLFLTVSFHCFYLLIHFFIFFHSFTSQSYLIILKFMQFVNTLR